MSADELAAKLLTLARRDLRAAEILSEQEEVGDGIVGFHAQQAARNRLPADPSDFRLLRAYAEDYDAQCIFNVRWEATQSRR